MKKELNSRQLILMLLKKHKEQTVSDLAQSLGVTEMAVRRHLQSLEKAGMIQSRVERQAMGRPSHHYSLTDEGDESFPRNYGDLSLGILEDLENMSGKEIVDQLFEQRRERLHQKYASSMDGDFHERVETLAQIQTEKGYMVELEQQEDGSYRFVEYNCPIAQVAKQYPIACQCEQQLFRQLLKTDNIERMSCIAKENTNCCMYTIKEE